MGYFALTKSLCYVNHQQGTAQDSRKLLRLQTGLTVVCKRLYNDNIDSFLQQFYAK